MTLTREEKLVLLIEECGEVIQAATKCLRFGYDSLHIADYGRNDHKLAAEVGDLMAVVEALNLDEAEMAKTRSGKIAKAEHAKKIYGVV